MFRNIVQKQFSRFFFKRNICVTQNNEILFDYINQAGIVQLNKPKTLNALTHSMIKQLYSKMKEWESDEKTQFIIIKSTGPKAFSAGGDLKILTSTSLNSENIRNTYLKDEYQLLYLIGTYKLPYVALINGITMGGGCGLSIHGSFRIATEITTVAMPETAIGLFPNAGGSYFLSRLSNNLGVFLGLTGHRLHGMDVLHAGIATHFLPTNRLQEIEQKLLKLPKADYNSIKNVLDENTELVTSKSSFSLQEQLPLINRIFAIDTKNVETIFEQLKSDGSSFALKQIEILKNKSPTSLKITLEQLKRGKQFDLNECLKMEYRILHYVIHGHDFFEGVRAVLIDKDNKPQWKPNSLENISNQDIESYFEKLSPNNELQLS
ncbi:unnamed protein product [Rotaria socialis]|uniref:3-hydroxyisobutyryl-CoA hydrolase, mitochondrial n=2 Tax=Rotaria socialis TaxID=392032 RepID=A0A818M7Q8_9BILA|nr:unnamed protein product [Rotaria socialis]CAF3585922.1 unnamed protein product [Rotaria socialis]CAF4225745.1 unnamed protein product [Rotaria socialis]